jgi:SAP domain
LLIVLLNEEDVPGAKFVSGEVSEHSIAQLKRWLQFRGLKSSGKKETLVDRQAVQRGPYLQFYHYT